MYHSSGNILRAKFAPEKLHRVRHVMICVSPYVLDFSEQPVLMERNRRTGNIAQRNQGILGYGIHMKTWTTMLGNLATLRLVVDMIRYRMSVSGRSNPPKHKLSCVVGRSLDRKSWRHGLVKVLRYLDKRVSPTVDVFADMDEMPIPAGMLDRHLGRKWTHVRTSTGDLMLERIANHLGHTPTDRTPEVKAEMGEVFDKGVETSSCQCPRRRQACWDDRGS
jgi:hypothetical protein